MSRPLSIRFDGAARTVTGSRHVIRWGERTWLFDCGIYQGHRDEAERVNRTFRFDPADIDAVVLSHAHLDHAGNLPTFVAQGGRAAVHATPATVDLCAVMLPDSAFLMERDVAHVNKRHPERPRTPLAPLMLAPPPSSRRTSGSRRRIASSSTYCPLRSEPGE